MEHEYSFNAKWGKGLREDHTINLELEVALSDFVRGKDIAVELAMHEPRVRREITEMVIHKLIPHIIAKSGIYGDFPEGRTHTKSHADSHSKWEIDEPKNPGESLSIRSKLQILFEINADRAVNAMQALNLSKGILAARITDDIVFSLKRKYLGVNEESVSSKTKTSDGKVVDHRATSKTDFQGN